MNFTFDYDPNLSSSYQGQLASAYTSQLMAYLQTAEGADYVAYLAYTGGMGMDAALALKTSIINGEFSLSGLFGAAQSKTGGVGGDAITDPTPTLTVGDATVNLSAMLAGLATDTWTTSTKKDTIYHTREFYTESQIPDGYTSDWANPTQNEAPTDIHLAIDATFAASLASGTTTGTTGATIGILIATDPDAGDTHTFAIEGDNPGGRFVIDGNQLKLAEGKEIKEGDGSFDITIKVTDSAGNTYYETFSFSAGGTSPNANNTVNGSAADGDGSSTVPTVGDDVIFGFTGNDTLGTTITGTSGDDAIFGGAGNDKLYGGDGNDQLFGGAGNDELYGGNGNDILIGGDGNDILIGGAGKDTMTGGLGNDTFKFNATADSSATLSLADVITDFRTGTNKIDLSAIDADTSVIDDQAFAFVPAPTTGAVANSITWYEDSGNTIVQINNSGGTTVNMAIILNGTSLGLNASDFIL